MLKIVQAPAEVLATEAKEVSSVSAGIKKLIKEMTKTLLAAKDPEGVGLAAPQIGESLRLFIIKESPDAPLHVFINPVITSMSEIPSRNQEEKDKHKQVKLEGCLSLQNVWGVVNRAEKVTVTYLDENAKKHTKTFSGFLAVIIQHEYDHINGILFPKRVLEQQEKLYKATKDKKGETVFEELEI